MHSPFCPSSIRGQNLPFLVRGDRRNEDRPISVCRYLGSHGSHRSHCTHGSHGSHGSHRTHCTHSSHSSHGSARRRRRASRRGRCRRGRCPCSHCCSRCSGRLHVLWDHTRTTHASSTAPALAPAAIFWGSENTPPPTIELTTIHAKPITPSLPAVLFLSPIIPPNFF